jgi:predicted DNA-binding ribbon-helix-helix protein
VSKALTLLVSWRNKMKSAVVKRSIALAGHKTSVSLEDAFWRGLKQIARARNTAIYDLIALIDAQRKHANLSSAIRLFVLEFYQLNEDTSARNERLDMIAVQPTISA